MSNLGPMHARYFKPLDECRADLASMTDSELMEISEQCYDLMVDCGEDERDPEGYEQFRLRLEILQAEEIRRGLVITQAQYEAERQQRG